MIDKDKLRSMSEEERVAALESALKAIELLMKPASQRRRLARKLAPVHESARDELRLLVRQHWAQTRGSVALHAMGSDRVDRKTKEVIPCAYPDDFAGMLRSQADMAKRCARDLEPAIEAQLAKLPIYTEFLSRVIGFGSIVSAYMIGYIRIDWVCKETGRVLKPSNLRRYCGMAVINGQLERMEAGEERKYNHDLRKRLWQGFQSMRKNAAKTSICADHRGEQKRMGLVSRWSAQQKEAFRAACLACPDCQRTERPNGVTNKYLDVWYNAKQGALLEGKTPGKADSKGWSKAVDVFLLDLYTIWRAIEGLPVFPSYYEHRLGAGHRGWHILRPEDATDQHGRILTLDEALQLAGDFGERALKAPRVWAAAAKPSKVVPDDAQADLISLEDVDFDVDVNAWHDGV